ncbi:hypothetical protein MTO96_032455 [Rhipicephalus appendiculatus]
MFSSVPLKSAASVAAIYAPSHYLSQPKPPADHDLLPETSGDNAEELETDQHSHMSINGADVLISATQIGGLCRCHIRAVPLSVSAQASCGSRLAAENLWGQRRGN